jgi:hypothetical protein
MKINADIDIFTQKLRADVVAVAFSAITLL